MADFKIPLSEMTESSTVSKAFRDGTNNGTKLGAFTLDPSVTQFIGKSFFYLGCNAWGFICWFELKYF